MKKFLTHNNPEIRRFAKQVLNGTIPVFNEPTEFQNIEGPAVFGDKGSLEKSKLKGGVLLFLQSTNIRDCVIEGPGLLIIANHLITAISCVIRDLTIESGTAFSVEIVESVERYLKK